MTQTEAFIIMCTYKWNNIQDYAFIYRTVQKTILARCLTDDNDKHCNAPSVGMWFEYGSNRLKKTVNLYNIIKQIDLC